jgi:hypothetical protein
VPAFDLVIADEAHRCAGPKAGPFATVIDSRKIKVVPNLQLEDPRARVLAGVPANRVAVPSL